MKKLEIEGLTNEAQNEAIKNEQEGSIEFSSTLVNYLSNKAKVFKKNCKTSLTVDHLKKVYCAGARLGAFYHVEDLNLYALARVHMFLRLKSGEKMTVKDNLQKANKPIELELEPEKPQKNIRLSSFIDISESWIPSEEDFKESEKEIEENDLKYKYNNINDLYLEYEPIKPTWD